MKKRNNLEFILRDYLSKQRNLHKLNSELIFVEKEKIIDGGRIDILASEKNKPVVIELKVNKYSTQHVCVQLLNYINYVNSKKGKVIFIAPKVKLGVYTTLKKYYEEKKLEFYEVKIEENKYIFSRVEKEHLDDSRKIPYFDEIKKIPENYFIKKTINELSKKNKILSFAKSLLQPKNKNYLKIAEKGLDLISYNTDYITKKKAKALKNLIRILE